MNTYKAVRGPALEYASSIWSSLASSTSINKLQIVQISALRTLLYSRPTKTSEIVNLKSVGNILTFCKTSLACHIFSRTFIHIFSVKILSIYSNIW